MVVGLAADGGIFVALESPMEHRITVTVRAVNKADFMAVGNWLRKPLTFPLNGQLIRC